MKQYTVKVYEDRTEWHNEAGQLHREDGPAIEWANGTKEWYVNGQRHREDGPAVEYSTGTKWWHVNGKLHREDGPAVEWSDGTKEWWINGKCHREGGPAIECSNGTEYWYINGKRLTKQEFNRRKNPCEGKVVEVDGKKYKLTLI